MIACRVKDPEVRHCEMLLVKTIAWMVLKVGLQTPFFKNLVYIVIIAVCLLVLFLLCLKTKFDCLVY